MRCSETLAICRYVHVLADALPILQDPCLGLSTEYPWAMTIATAATLGTFTLEWVLHKTFRRRLLAQDEHENTKHDPEVQASPPNSGVIDARESKIRALRVMVMSYTYEIGIIFHSKYSATGRRVVSGALAHSASKACAVCRYFHWYYPGHLQ